jgi:hypothetical protein
MNRAKLAMSLLASASLLAAGCASIVSKSDWPVTFKSNPSGAKIVIRDHEGKELHNGTTPLTVTLHASKGYMQAATYNFEVTQDGFKPASGSVKAGVNGWFFGNFGFGGLIGFLIVDPLTGAAFRLPPETSIDLLPIQTAGKTPSLTILTLNEVPAHLRSQLLPIQ